MAEGSSGLDFREGMVKKHLKGIRRVLLVLSGKGGVGKSVVSATFAAILADSGYRVGLMDADIYGPSSALLLGARGLPEERDAGIIPPTCAGVKVMSVDLFASGRPVPLTGSAASEVIVELLALTDWGELDCLVVDMPPATGDIMMTLTTLGKKGASAVVVTMPDRLSTTVARRVLQLLKSGRFPTVGVLGNMVGSHGSTRAAEGAGLGDLAKEFGVPLLGLLPYDAGVARAVEKGNATSLLATAFAKALGRSMIPYLDGFERRRGGSPRTE